MAETRTIRTVLELQNTQFKAGLAASSAAAKQAAGAIRDLEQSGSKLSASYGTVSNTLLGFGTATALGLGYAGKAAMDWESAWAGVRKTVDGSDKEMAALEKELRGLARTLPASHKEIAGVAEAAGQLGVKREDVASFTKTMIDLGESTNLSADEAATGLARFSNVMGTSTKDVGRLGSTIVALGNNFATTESEILAMSQRLAGAGRMVGLTEPQVMALATAMSSVGIEAEAGGTAMSMVLKKINRSVNDSGEKLEAFADLAGMSADEFATAWKNDPQTALVSLIQGLKRAGASGQDMSAIMTDLGIKGSREQDAMLRLAGGVEKLASATDLGSKAWKENTALAKEAAQRYETAESKIKIAMNGINDAAIDMGAILLPAIASAAQGVSGLVEAFNALPQPVKDAVTVLGSVVAVTAIATGGAMKLIPAVMRTVEAYKTLAKTVPQAARAISAAGKAMGALTVVFAVVEGLTLLADSLKETGISADEAAARLVNFAQKGKITAEQINQIAASGEKPTALIKSLGLALKSVDADPVTKGIDFLSSGLGIFGTHAAAGAESLQRLDTALAAAASSGNIDTLTKAFNASAEEASKYGYTTEDLIEKFPLLRAQLVQLANDWNVEATNANLAKIATGELKPAADQAAGGAKNLAGGLKDTTGAAKDAGESIEEVTKRVTGMGNAFLGARDAQRGFEEALDDADEALKKYGKNLDRGTEAGRNNEAALDGIASATLKWVAQEEKAGATAEMLNGILEQGRAKYIAHAKALGLTAEQAEELADNAGLLGDAYKDIPSEVNTTVTADTKDAETGFTTVSNTMSMMDGTTVTTLVSADTSSLEGKVDKATLDLARLEGQKPTPLVGLDTSTMIKLAAAATIRLNELAKMKPTPEIRAEMAQLQRTVDASKRELRSVPTSTIAKVLAEVYGREKVASLRNAISAVNSKSVTVRVSTIGVGSLSTMRASLALNQGGWVGKGLAAGGWVPGKYPGPGRDNILWPIAPGRAAGGMLAQPLAGNEFVVNGKSAREWAPVLESINNGAKPHQFTTGGIDTGAVATAVAQAMSNWQPMVNIDGTRFYGVMKKAAYNNGESLNTTSRR
ncbi:phage tail tape measure protein [Dermabacteraceae bacterium P7006]